MPLFRRRYPHIRQADVSDCGPASLAAVAMLHGLRLSPQQLRELAGTDAVGTSMRGLREAAARLGFVARVVHGPIESLALAPLPAIAHIASEDGLGHYVVVHRVKKGKILVGDPAADRVRWWNRDEFARRWTGYLMLLTPDQLATVGGDCAPAWLRLLRLIVTHRGVLLEAFVCAIFMTLLGVSSSLFLQHLIDSVLVRHEERLLHALGIGMVLVLVFRIVFSGVRQYMLAHLGRKVDLLLTGGLGRHLLRVPILFFESRRVGEILSRMHDTAKVRDAISGTTLTVMVDSIVVVAMLAVLWIYDAPLAALATAFVPILTLATAAHLPAVRRSSREAMERSAQYAAHMAEDVSSIETIRAYSAEDLRSDQAETRLVKLASSSFRLQLFSLSMGLVGTFVTGAAGLAVLWYGGCRVMSGALTVGELIFFYSLLGYLLDPLQRLASVNLAIQDALIAMDRLGQMLDVAPESPPEASRMKFDGLTSCVELRDVTFRYGSRNNALESVNLRIPRGATVALVGESGSGKSTILKLLAGFYPPTAGRIEVDGIDLRDIDIASFRERLGIVSQDSHVFNATIRENVSLGRPDATLDEVIDAVRAAGLSEFLDTLPDRYETKIGERGVNLSGGQRQRLAIARALLRQPELLILDEATSHLDTVTEQWIQQNLSAANAARTVLIVAHRLSTIRDADLIYVMHHGRIVESGTHDDLLELGGRYAALWSAQTGIPTPTLARRRSTSMLDTLVSA